MSGFDKLHPALQHHIVNSLGWRSLRPLQEVAIAPLLAGEHAILIAPTAGGKTEAAIFPLFSRMLTEDWRGLGVLYVCPIRALLNNLANRLQGYASLLGRRVELWHGDVGPTARRRIGASPPDVLLTTPESIEVMLVSNRTDRRVLFEGTRAVVVDELHAFAGDDRGWHLLSVLERVARLARRELQRVGLSATIGNPESLLDWLAGSCTGARRVVAPGLQEAPPSEVTLDFVGNLANAATVISRLHRGEKRLVFVDSRSRVEELAARLRTAGVATFVSHGSLGVDARRQAERAFAEERDAVIVATSTLELGIDVGDLDRVIQIDAPSTVASFLQRLGRTGRRPGSVRNCLFLATGDEAFLRAAGLLTLWADGYVEPVEPPPAPFHLLAQQLLALALQEGGVGRHTWREWIGCMPAFSSMEPEIVDAVIAHMLRTGMLFEEAGILSIGVEGERAYGRRHFLELTSIFVSDPAFVVRHGRSELGQVDPSTFWAKQDEPVVLLLAGRSWRVTHVDWRQRIAYVEPSEVRGRSRWLGAGRPLHFELCRAVRRVLTQGEVPERLTSRAMAKLEALRTEFAWIDESSTQVVRDEAGELRWWTFAGQRANRTLGRLLGGLRAEAPREENLSIRLSDTASPDGLEAALRASGHTPALDGEIRQEALDGLKFSECLPVDLARRLLVEREADLGSVERVISEPRRFISV